MIKEIEYNKLNQKTIFNIFNKKKYLVCVVHNLFSKKESILAKDELIQFIKKKKFINKNKKMFQRWDINPKKGMFKRVMWSCIFEKKNDKYFKNCIKILNRSLKIKNSFIKNYEKKNNIKFKYQLTLRGSFYPSGKGYYAEHSDLNGGELILDIIPLSIVKEDYESGGLAIRSKQNKLINIEHKMRHGSVCYLKNSVNHKIQLIDKKKRFNKNLHIGRFSLISTTPKKINS